MGMEGSLDVKLIQHVALDLDHLVPACTQELWDYHLAKRKEKQLNAKIEAALNDEAIEEATKDTAAALADKSDPLTEKDVRKLLAEERKKWEAELKRQARSNSSGGPRGQRSQPQHTKPTANGDASNGNGNGNSSSRNRRRRRNRQRQNQSGSQGGSNKGKQGGAAQRSTLGEYRERAERTPHAQAT